MIRADRLAILKKGQCFADPFSVLCWWVLWDHKTQVNPQQAWEYPLFEGKGFVGELGEYKVDWYNAPSEQYDAGRCGAFADWLEENTERLTEKHSEVDRPAAAERLRALAEWLRSGFQKSS